jgi:uncharacterized protein YbaR (Trm112 family)
VAELISMGRTTVLACPQCESPLYEIEEAGSPRFCCAAGHNYAPDEVCPGIADDLEALLPELIDALRD